MLAPDLTHFARNYGEFIITRRLQEGVVDPAAYLAACRTFLDDYVCESVVESARRAEDDGA